MILTTTSVLFVALNLVMVPRPVRSGDITDRSLILNSSVAGKSGVNYSFNFSVPSETVIKSFEVEVCTTAYETCIVPDGFGAGEAGLLDQPNGFGDPDGWEADAADASPLRMHNGDNSSPPGEAQTVTFSNVTNPDQTNMTFFGRLTTYANDDYTDEIDSGVVAASTVPGTEVVTSVPPILVFCLGSRIPSDCSSAEGAGIDFGTFSPEAPSSATSHMRAATNAQDGYVITVKGDTLASGTNRIPAMEEAAASQPGTSQFGFNLRDNDVPDAGQDPVGPGIGTYTEEYGDQDRFRFVSGEAVARASRPSRSNTFTAAYMVNIDPEQPAGVYRSTMTYICTATF
jgi:hypothetical protein